MMTLEELRNKRMAEDLAMLQNPANWPCDPIHVKTQAWLDGQRRFGWVASDNPLSVFDKEAKTTEEFSSLEELVKTWSID